MPRNRSVGRSAPSRPSAPRSAPAPQQQQRSASTMAAAPPATTSSTASAPQAQGPGLFGQMASTAAGVAIGSSVGHAIGGLFGGSSSEPAPQQEQQQQQMQPMQAAAQQPMQHETPACQPALADFNRCLHEKNDVYSCGWYFEQLKACRAAAAGQ
ncbi:hypothetical protein XA68_13250 [Ophiocordyceps unilateralis]|uniref:CHCH domain-containing protein n=1 Tax=Ophiocordyceps unilateralis TaxID=268505 RepID=A0A2A9PN67_OPHUN|nr:hypothetical protein XA68_13250 [Ophiocordyceps unilateralis]